MSEQTKTAVIRAVYGAILTAIVVGVGLMQTTDPTDSRRMEVVVVGMVGAAASYLVARGGIEGAVDTARASAVRSGTGEPIASDIVTPA